MVADSVSGRKDLWLILSVALGVLTFIASTVTFLMQPKAVLRPEEVATPTATSLPTITPLPTMTPFPTGTPFPTYTPLPTLSVAPETNFTSEVTGTSQVAAGVEVTYTVQEGDTVSDIADKFGISVAALLVANDLDDETIFPDQVLIIPDDDGSMAEALIHIVRSGETLGGIASDYGISVEALREANGLDTDIIQLGQRLIIPRE